MPKYIRVNLKDKFNNIIYPNIHNNIKIENDTGMMHLERNIGDVMFYFKRADTGTEVSVGVGSGGINHGIWSKKFNKWMVYGDSTNIYLNGIATKATQDSDGNTIKSTYLKLSGGVMTGNLYFGNIKTSTTDSNKIVFGNTSTAYSCIRANQGGAIVFSNSLTSGGKGLCYTPSESCIRPDANKALDIGTSSLRFNNVYASGAEFTNRCYFYSGTSVKNLANGAGTAGFMYACRMTITREYENQYMSFEILQRSRYGQIFLQFAGGNTKDPNISTFCKNGNITAYMNKAATSTWDLYIAKSEAYDNIEISHLGKGAYSNGVNIEWKNSTVANVPSSAKAASTQYIMANLSGTATNATNSDNIKKHITNPTGGTSYEIFFSAKGTSTDVYFYPRTNNGLTYYTLEGTTSQVGKGELQLGNGTAAGTAGNKVGLLRIWAESSGSHYISPNNTTTKVWHYLPTTGGTLLNTGTTSFTRSWSKGDKVGTIKINNTSTDFYSVDYKIYVGTDGQSLTLGANSAYNADARMKISRANIGGYTWMACLGGYPNGTVGFICQANGWVYNTSHSSLTASSINWIHIYKRNSNS